MRDRRCRVHVHGVSESSGSLSSPSSSPVVLVVAMLAGGFGEEARAGSARGARVDIGPGADWAFLFRGMSPCKLSRFCAFCAGLLINPPLPSAASEGISCTELPSVEAVSLLSRTEECRLAFPSCSSRPLVPVPVLLLLLSSPRAFIFFHSNRTSTSVTSDAFRSDPSRIPNTPPTLSAMPPIQLSSEPLIHFRITQTYVLGRPWGGIVGDLSRA